MFEPSRDQARSFWFELWAKHHAKTPLSPLETLALDLAIEHPEYHDLLAHPEAARERDWTPEQGATNPFLHLGLHLAIREQVSIDQPIGIRALYESLARRLDSSLEAEHRIMDCLVEQIWNAQKHGTGFDGEAYVECIRKHAARD